MSDEILNPWAADSCELTEMTQSTELSISHNHRSLNPDILGRRGAQRGRGLRQEQTRHHRRLAQEGARATPLAFLARFLSGQTIKPSFWSKYRNLERNKVALLVCLVITGVPRS